MCSLKCSRVQYKKKKTCQLSHFQIFSPPFVFAKRNNRQDSVEKVNPNKSTYLYEQKMKAAVNFKNCKTRIVTHSLSEKFTDFPPSCNNFTAPDICTAVITIYTRIAFYSKLGSRLHRTCTLQVGF